MAVDYSRVTDALKKNITVIGRSQDSAYKFEKVTGKKVVTGGLQAFIDSKPDLPESAIVCVSIEQLATAAKILMNYGVKKILLEKPGGVSNKEIQSVADTALASNSSIMIAYNRRYYASVLKAKEMIEADGGVSSFNFEITEWSHVIENHNKDVKTMHSWFLGNTSHVVDAAFFLCGTPVEISTFKKGTLSWHPSSSKFAGAGSTNKGALFSYCGNWEGPGRWSLDVITNVHRYIFRPFEQLHIQDIGSVAHRKVEINDAVEKDLKPGLYLQCKNFFDSNFENMCSIEEQVNLSSIYENMAGYN